MQIFPFHFHLQPSNICNYGKQLQNAWFFPVVRFIYAFFAVVVVAAGAAVLVWHAKFRGRTSKQASKQAKKKKLRDFGVFMFDFPLEIHSIVSSLLWFRLWRQVIWILYYSFPSYGHLARSLALRSTHTPRVSLTLFGWLFHCRFLATT